MWGASVVRSVALLTLAMVMAWGTASAGAKSDDAEKSSEPPPEFTEAYLNDPANVEAGKAIWQDQCGLCHGASAYPGKAPKLKPRRYKPDWVFRRVTKGFRQMPAWKEIYTREERMSVVAFVMSKKFSP